MELLKKETIIGITFLIDGKIYERVETKTVPGDSVILWYGNDDENEEYKKLKIRFMSDLKFFDDKEELYQQKHESLTIIEEDIDTTIRVRHNNLIYRRFEYFNITRDVFKVHWDGNGCDENGFEQCKLGDHKGAKFEDFIEDLENNYQKMNNGK